MIFDFDKHCPDNKCFSSVFLYTKRAVAAFFILGFVVLFIVATVFHKQLPAITQEISDQWAPYVMFTTAYISDILSEFGTFMTDFFDKFINIYIPYVVTGFEDIAINTYLFTVSTYNTTIDFLIPYWNDFLSFCASSWTSLKHSILSSFLHTDIVVHCDVLIYSDGNSTAIVPVSDSGSSMPIMQTVTQTHFEESKFSEVVFQNGGQDEVVKCYLQHISR